MTTKAIIFTPDNDDFARHATRCATYCEARGYEIDSYIRGDWETAAEMLKTGQADAIIVARPEHLDPERKPRVEVALPHPDDACRPDVPQRARRRRPRQL